MIKHSGTVCAPRFTAEGPMAHWWTRAKKTTKVFKKNIYIKNGRRVERLGEGKKC